MNAGDTVLRRIGIDDDGYLTGANGTPIGKLHVFDNLDRKNAAFIVLAVNNHERLLEAVRATLDDWHSHPENIRRKEPRYLSLLRAAIAAEGRTA